MESEERCGRHVPTGEALRIEEGLAE